MDKERTEVKQVDDAYAQGWTSWSRLYYPVDFEVNTLVDAMPDLSSKKVLEVGCGDGRVTERLKLSCPNITAIDIDQELIDKLSQSGSTVNYKAMSGLDLKFEDESFDTVCYFWSVHQMKPMKQAIMEAHRCLKKGGHIAVFGLTERGEYDDVVEAFGKDPGHHMESYDEHLKSIESVFGSLNETKKIGKNGEYGFRFEDEDSMKRNWLWSLENWHGMEPAQISDEQLLSVLEKYRRDKGYFLNINGVFLLAQK